MDTIPIIIENDEDYESETLGIGGSGKTVKNIDVDKLQASMTKLSAQVSKMLEAVEDVKGFQLDEVSLSAEISGEGEIKLIGGLKVGAKGAVSFTFRRQ